MSDGRIVARDCVVRGTHRRKGRTEWLAPERGALQWLHYGRIVLDGGIPEVGFSNPDRETGLICLKGRGSIRVPGMGKFDVGPYDGVYVPRGAPIEVTAGAEGCDLAEVSAPVEAAYPLQFVSFDEVRRDPALSFPAGGSAYARHINIILGHNVRAGRILAGATFSSPGNWTSWPPHEHGDMLEEAYLFIDMPAPAWGIQFVYTDPAFPELIAAVREGDCVLMPAGYHPNVAAPGGCINFLWMMAARREGVDRCFGVVNVQPEYASAASGLDSGRG
jgi:5-deoxy-glucuronate isomerase